jgi:hypothetical protein
MKSRWINNLINLNLQYFKVLLLGHFIWINTITLITIIKSGVTIIIRICIRINVKIKSHLFAVTKSHSIIGIASNRMLLFLLLYQVFFLQVQAEKESFFIFLTFIFWSPTFTSPASESLPVIILHKCYCFPFVIAKFMKFLAFETIPCSSI